MDGHLKILRRIFLLGVLAHLILFVFAVVFYKERVLFSDASYYLYSILKDDTFFIQHQRFGGFFGELLAVLACKLGMQVSQIAIAYSVGFIFFHFMVYLIVGLVLREYKWALMILLALLLYISDGFYAPQSELPLGITFFCLFMALLQRSKSFSVQLAVIVCCMPFIVFFHPLFLFITAYTVCYFLLQKESFTRRQITVVAIAYLVVVAVKLVFFRDKYEGETTGLGYFIKLFPNYYTDSLHHFLIRCLTKYCWITILFLMTVRHYYVTRKWKNLMLTTGATIGYILLVHISHPYKEGLDFYMEIIYMPLSVFIGLPVMFDLLPAIKANRMALIIVVLVTTGLMRIFMSHDKYTARLNWQRQYLQLNGHQKQLVRTNEKFREILMITWPSPFEFCLLSTIESDRTASINFCDSPAIFSHLLEAPKTFIHTWDGIGYSELRQDRFKFRDTVSTYHVVE